MSAMSIKLGPALKICSAIDAMREELKQNWRRAHKKRVLFKLGSTLVGEVDVLHGNDEDDDLASVSPGSRAIIASNNNNNNNEDVKTTSKTIKENLALKQPLPAGSPALSIASSSSSGSSKADIMDLINRAAMYDEIDDD